MTRRLLSALRLTAPVLFAIGALAPPPVAATPQGKWLEFGAPSRAEHVAIYDPAGDRMLVITGTNGARRNEVWSLDFQPAPGWNLLQVAGTPISPRDGEAGIFDPVRNRVIIFGGITTSSGVGSTVLNDVWELSLSGTPTWNQFAPAGTPPQPRRDHTAIYDPVGDRMIIFGGYRSTGGEGNDVWALSLAGTPTWSQLAPAGGPPATRSDATAIYDDANARMVMFGGYSSSVPAFQDTWELSLPASGTPTWTQMAPSGTLPGPRAFSASLYDPVRGRTILVGGQGGTADVWELTLGATPTWTEITPAVSGPIGRSDHSVVYDRARDALVLYGGLTSNYLADSWRLPLSGTPAWEPLIVPVRPPARTHHTAILDRTSNRLITFGGANEDGAQTNDVWSLTLGTLPIWTPITPATPGGAPAARRDAASIFDPVRNRMIVFGGYTGGTRLNDVWALSLDADPTWTRLFPTGTAPVTRYGAAAAYDPAGDRMIIFGGTSSASSNLGDTKALSLGGVPTWSTVAVTIAPQGRQSAKMIYDSVGNRMILFGGWRSSGSITDQFLSDTWQLALGETPDWSPLSSASPPPGRTLHALAYDELRDRVLVQDGYGVIATGNPTYLGMFDDVYARPLDGSSPWGILAPEGASPGAREAQVSIFDPDLDRLITYAGGRSATADSWFLSFRDDPPPAPASLVSVNVQAGEVHLEWAGREIHQPTAHVYRKPQGGSWSQIGTVVPDGSNAISFVDTDAPSSGTCRYEVGFTADQGEQVAGAVDVVLSTTGLPPSAAKLALALHGARLTADRLEVAFGLADESSARLDLLDLAGRRVASRDVTAFGSGEHRATLAGPSVPPSGIYWVRLSQRGEFRVLRVAILR